MSSRSSTSKLQISNVRSVSPRPPRALLFNATVLTNAARRHQRSFERDQRMINESGTWRSRQLGPDRKQANVSTASQLAIPLPKRSNDLRFRLRAALF